MIYHSKKDWWLVALVWAGVLLLLSIAVYHFATPSGNAYVGWTLIFVAIGISAIVIFLTYPLYYEITASKLIVRCGALVRKEIPLSSIMEARPSRNPQGAPAWSLDRLQIDYRRNGGTSFVLISPQDKLRFLNELAGSGPELEVRGERVVRIV